MYLASAVAGLIERNVLVLFAVHAQPCFTGVSIRIISKFHLRHVVKQLRQMPLNLRVE